MIQMARKIIYGLMASQVPTKIGEIVLMSQIHSLVSHTL